MGGHKFNSIKKECLLKQCPSQNVANLTIRLFRTVDMHISGNIKHKDTGMKSKNIIIWYTENACPSGTILVLKYFLT